MDTRWTGYVRLSLVAVFALCCVFLFTSETLESPVINCTTCHRGDINPH